MQSALRIKAIVHAGGKVELVAPQMPVDSEVDVIILFPASHDSSLQASKRSVLNILAEAPGHRLFNTPEDVEEYLAGEHGAWTD